MKRLLNVCVLAVVLLMNPLWGCSDTEPEFEYDRQDMVDYAVGTWKGTLQLPSGEETGFELVIMEPSAQARKQGLEFREVKQAACGNREFGWSLGALLVRDAYACVSSSSLLVEARLTTDDGSYKDQPLTGDVSVMGRILERSSISLGFADGGRLFTECGSDYKCGEGQFSGGSGESGGKLMGMQKK